MVKLKRSWWKESIVYQIYPRSFMDSNEDGIGDLNGIIEKLDYIKDLGVNVLWLCPIYKSPNDDNGYDISDYRQIMDEFGTMKDFDLMLKEIHKRGMKLLMDLVVNHTSDEHQWFVESRKSKDNEYRDYYIWKEAKDGHEPNNWGASFGGSTWEFDEETQMYYLHCFSKKQPDLNWENPKVRKEVQDIVKWWLDKGIDGFRMDVINMVSKNQDFPDGPKEEGKLYGDLASGVMNGPRIHEYLKELNQNVLRNYDVMTVGETPNVTPETAEQYVGENRQELNMVFQFELMDIDRDFEKLTKKPLNLVALKKTFTKWQKGLENKGWNSLYWNNHDQPRVVSRFGDEKEYWEKSAKMLATCLHMQQGTPYIYQGEEIGMTNVKFEKLEDYKDISVFNGYKDEVLIKKMKHEDYMEYIYNFSRDNARTPMQWTADENAGFTVGTPWIKVNPNYKKINVQSQLEDSESILNYYRKLIQIRKENDVVVYGSYDLLLEEHEEIYVYTRTLGERKLIVICNFTKNEPVFTFPENINIEKFKTLIGNYNREYKSEKQLRLKPYESIVLTS